MDKFFTFPLTNPFQFLQNLGRAVGESEGTAFLYSGGSLDSAKHSYFFLFPKEKIEIAPASNECAWNLLQSKLAFSSKNHVPEWVGFFSYEMGYTSDKDIKIEGCYEENFPLACFYKASCVVKVYHQACLLEVYLSNEAPSFLKDEHFWQPLFVKEELLKDLHHSVTSLQCSDSVESYVKKITAIKEGILNGDVYQANLSQEFHIRLKEEIDAFSLYLQLLKINPPPFSAYLKGVGFTIVSMSPERLLKKEGLKLETRPIKGTMPRGKSEVEDQFFRTQLKNSPKEKAELLMITDLMRNDLSRVCDPGSVLTKEIWRVEEYANVFHLISIIEGYVRKELHPIQIIKELFPGGSITGCPKLKAMEFISLLEKRARRIYTGSIGYFTSDGDFDFSIAIRTLMLTKNEFSIQLGGGIVIDSDPHKEFEETLHKGQSLFKVLGLGELLL